MHARVCEINNTHIRTLSNRGFPRTRRRDIFFCFCFTRNLKLILKNCFLFFSPQYILLRVRQTDN